MKTITLQQNSVTKNTDYLFTAHLDEVLHTAKDVYLNVKSVLGHDNFYLNSHKYDDLVSYSICNNTSTLGHVVVLSADCHMFTRKREYFTEYRFFHYAFAEYKDSIQFYSHSQVINHLDRKYYMNDGLEPLSCIDCNPFDYIDTCLETQGEVMSTLCPTHLYDYVYGGIPFATEEPVTDSVGSDDGIKGDVISLTVEGIELSITPIVHKNYVYYITQSFDVPALGRNVQLDASFCPAPSDEYEWNGGIHADGDDFSFHSYRMCDGYRYALTDDLALQCNLRDIFTELVHQLNGIRSIKGSYSDIGAVMREAL